MDGKKDGKKGWEKGDVANQGDEMRSLAKADLASNGQIAAILSSSPFLFSVSRCLSAPTLPRRRCGRPVYRSGLGGDVRPV
jgi:hypothetical protein